MKIQARMGRNNQRKNIQPPLCSVTVLPPQRTSGKHPHIPWHLRTDTVDQSPCGFLWLHGHWRPFLQKWKISVVFPFHPLYYQKECLLDGELKFSSSLIFWVWKIGFQSTKFQNIFSTVLRPEFIRHTSRIWEWWYMYSTPPSTWEAECRALWTEDQPGLHTVFHTSQGHLVRPCLKNKPNKLQQNDKEWLSSFCSCKWRGTLTGAKWFWFWFHPNTHLLSSLRSSIRILLWFLTFNYLFCERIMWLSGWPLSW